MKILMSGHNRRNYMYTNISNVTMKWINILMNTELCSASRLSRVMFREPPDAIRRSSFPDFNTRVTSYCYRMTLCCCDISEAWARTI